MIDFEDNISLETPKSMAAAAIGTARRCCHYHVLDAKIKASCSADGPSSPSCRRWREITNIH